jgi:heterodisulfide reductase subunit A
MSARKVMIDPLTAVANEDLCMGCGLCVDLCPYGAPELVASPKGGTKAHIIEALCHGCGTCAASCPQKAIITRQFTDDQIYSEIQAALFENGKKSPVKKKAEAEAS